MATDLYRFQCFRHRHWHTLVRYQMLSSPLQSLENTHKKPPIQPLNDSTLNVNYPKPIYAWCVDDRIHPSTPSSCRSSRDPLFKPELPHDFKRSFPHVTISVQTLIYNSGLWYTHSEDMHRPISFRLPGNQNRMQKTLSVVRCAEGALQQQPFSLNYSLLPTRLSEFRACAFQRVATICVHRVLTVLTTTRPGSIGIWCWHVFSVHSTRRDAVVRIPGN